jgi:hypothetical protein
MSTADDAPPAEGDAEEPISDAHAVKVSDLALDRNNPRVCPEFG